MNARTKGLWITLGSGLVTGALLICASIWLSGATIVQRQTLIDQRNLIAELEEDNRLLSDDLFGVRDSVNAVTEDLVLPYSDDVDARAQVATARSTAMAQEKLLMITFGANWCIDCRTLHHTLNSADVAEYTNDRFLFANVNVGEFNRNIEVAAELGVSLARGIPVAIFYDETGAVIGTTNGGELEPARLYTSSQILNFVKDIAERAYILAPDAVR